MAVLRPLLSLAFGVAAVTWGAERAGASCVITLEGDPTTVARVQVELGSYPDEDSSCVALWVQCRMTGDQVEIDLHDELGRASLHLFASTEGAAAFIVSWSRRPLPPSAVSTEPLAPPSATASRALAVPLPAPASPGPPASHDEPWHPEFTMAYIVAAGELHNWAMVTASLIQRTGHLSYGIGLRGMLSNIQITESAEGVAIFGVGDNISQRLSILAGLMIGSTIAGRTGTYPAVVYGTHGFRGALHGTLRWHLPWSLDVEARLGYDVLRFDGDTLSTYSGAFGTHGYVSFTHVDIGMRWVP